ncbi:MAG TPA: DUF488 domain-containing protein [Thermoanaerobaculia bacterium]|nr:DUF488 domain-containing protein [Thermoanaerobaculia bacterium]
MLNRIYTIGHSTRVLEEFVALLREHGVTRLADVRRFPGSRRHPQFSGESMQRTLPEHGIDYVHFEALGGRRTPLKSSRNTALESDQFRGYADHMATAAFQSAVDTLLDADVRTAVMCAEANPLNCHRNLLSDELTRRNVEVVHILGRGSWKRHELHRLAKVTDAAVTYPAEGGQTSLFRGRV